MATWLPLGTDRNSFWKSNASLGKTWIVLLVSFKVKCSFWKKLNIYTSNNMYLMYKTLNSIFENIKAEFYAEFSMQNFKFRVFKSQGTMSELSSNHVEDWWIWLDCASLRLSWRTRGILHLIYSLSLEKKVSWSC